jgi:hypothetical protein
LLLEEQGGGRIFLWTIFSNSSQNASGTVPEAHLVRVTHPFHPLSGQQLPCVGACYDKQNKRVLLEEDEDTVWSVPRQWTDLVAIDPEVVIGKGRAIFRAQDLLDLSVLISRLNRCFPPENADDL